MCEFCIAHGEGKKWYLLMRHYSDELLHAELSGDQQAEARARTRAEWLERFHRVFALPAMTGVGVPVEEFVGAIMGTQELRQIAGQQVPADAILNSRKTVHFGQVVPLEDAEQVLDLASSITRIPCGCRFLSIGKTDKRYCLGLGMDALGGVFAGYPDSSSSLEVLTREQAKALVREFDREGLVHSVWTGIAPYILGLCNCDRDCLAYRGSIERRGAPSFFRAEYLARVDADLCNGCKACVQQCQFGAQHWSASLEKVDVDPTRCYGCGTCRSACPTNAIQMVPRGQVAKAATLWT